MSKQANLTVIGAFVVGAVGLAVLGLVVFGTGKFFKATARYVVFFEGSVKGLNPGAPVDFRGVKIGTVKDIKVSLSKQDLSLKIPVIIEIELDRIGESRRANNQDKATEEQAAKTLIEYLIQQGLRAQLGMQSFVTGQLYVLLDFFPGRRAKLVGGEPGYPEIPAVPSNREQIIETIQKLPLEDIINKLNVAMSGIAEFVTSPELKETVSSLNQTIKSVQSMVSNLDSRIEPLASDLSAAVKDIQKLTGNLDAQIKPVTAGLNETVKESQKLLRSIEGRVPAITTSLESTFKAVEGASKQAERTLSSVENVVGEHADLPYELAKTVKELSGAARSLRVLADYIERHPESFIKGKTQGTRKVE